MDVVGVCRLHAGSPFSRPCVPASAAGLSVRGLARGRGAAFPLRTQVEVQRAEGKLRFHLQHDPVIIAKAEEIKAGEILPQRREAEFTEQHVAAAPLPLTLGVDDAAIRTVTDETDAQFHRDIAALGVLVPTAEPRATEPLRPVGDQAALSGAGRGVFRHPLSGLDVIRLLDDMEQETAEPICPDEFGDSEPEGVMGEDEGDSSHLSYSVARGTTLPGGGGGTGVASLASKAPLPLSR